MRKNEGIFSALKYCFSPTFFVSLFFLLSRKECNYCAQVQGHQKTLNNPQLWDFKKLRDIELKPSIWNLKIKWISSLHIGTIPKITFKNLTPCFYTSNYGNYKIRSIKHYTQINIEMQSLELLCTKRCLQIL